MRFYIKLIDRFDGEKCYSVVEANSKKEAKAKYLRDHPIADIRGVGEIPDGCMTVGELCKILDKFPYCIPVYINSDGKNIASAVAKTLAYGMFECVEISTI